MDGISTTINSSSNPNPAVTVFSNSQRPVAGPTADQTTDAYEPGQQEADAQFHAMTAAYQQQMGSYLNNIHASTLPGPLKNQSGTWRNMEDSAQATGDEVLSLFGNTNATNRLNSNSDLQGGCLDLQAHTGEILKPFVNQPNSQWQASNIRVTPLPFSQVPGQHNAVVVYPKGGNPQNGYVFDPWSSQKAEAPIPYSEWKSQHWEDHFAYVGKPNDIGYGASENYTPLH